MTTNLASVAQIGHRGLDIGPFVKFVLPAVVLQPFLAQVGLTDDDLLYKNRRHLSGPHCDQLADLLWPSFVASMKNGNDVNPGEAKTSLGTKDQAFVRDQYQHTVFKHLDNLFVVEVERSGKSAEVLRCWKAPSTDVHPATVFVTFDTVAEKQDFDSVAARLGYRSDELLLSLARDFARTVNGRPPDT